MNIVFHKGAVVFREGDAADCMYEVCTGRIGVYAKYGTKEQKLLKEFLPDQYFGEMGLLEHAPRSATAVALEDESSVEAVTEENFGDFFRKNPARVLMILRQLSGNLRRTSLDYAETCRELQALAAEEETK